MKFWGALAIGATVAFGGVARADDCPSTAACPCDEATTELEAQLERTEQLTTLIANNDGDEELMKELEEQLNQVLLVDESGRIVLRPEFREGLPFPAERIEAMLGTFVELGEDGRLSIKNPDALRPYLPMLRQFLSPENMERMRELQDLPPDERRRAMQRMFAEGQRRAQGGDAPAPQPRRAEPAPQPRGPRAERAEGRNDERPRAAAPRDEVHGDVMARLDRIERSLDRIERMLDRAMEAHGEMDRGDEGRGQRRRRRGRADMGGLGGERLGQARERLEIYGNGIRRLLDMAEPGDMDLLRRVFQNLRGDMSPEDLQQPERIMGKLQEAIPGEDRARVIELLFQFMNSEEGRAMVEDLQRSAKELEEFVQSERGEELKRRMEGLQRLFDREGRSRGLFQAQEEVERAVRGRAPERSEQRIPERIGDARLY